MAFLNTNPLCECSCGDYVTWNKYKNRWNKFIKGHHSHKKEIQILKAQEPPLCKCGCGQKVSWHKNKRCWNRFIDYHKLKGGKLTKEQRRNQSLGSGGTGILKEDIIPRLCECGCGNYAKPGYTYIYGHQNTGKKFSKDWCDNLSKAHIGNEPWNKGLTDIYSEETLKSISDSLKGNVPWMKGKKFPKEFGEKISKAKKGKPSPMKGKKFPKEFGIKISKANKTWCDTSEAKKRFKDRMIKYYSDIENRIKMSCRLQGITREEWTHFVSCDPYCQIWTKEYKDFIKERDNYECQNPDCRKITNRLCVHHIDYDKKNCTPWNNITVCMSCNGRANGDRKYHQKFYENIIKEMYI